MGSSLPFREDAPMFHSLRVTLPPPVRVMAGILLLLAALATPSAASRAEGEASHVQPVRTAKERLGGKASDEQRVDNCKVPPELRGPKPRPDQCSSDAASVGTKH